VDGIWRLGLKKLPAVEIESVRNLHDKKTDKLLKHNPDDGLR
jgi:hypothetical protein